jgi:CheY-like chemotaxis protein/anti-sigma regulatory factor (Ser/Thr protein kinase)
LVLHHEAGDALWVDTDRTLLERVLRNLADNAIKYTEQGGVTVRARQAGDEVAIDVIDSGCGIASGERTRVFEEFYQIGNPERDRQRGLGLGLAIVKRLVELLRGRLELESEPQRGSRFTVLLRAAPIDAPAWRARGVPQARTLDGLHVLVVDDEADVRLGTRLLLEGLGCRVSTAAGTTEAVAAAAADAPDIVLADLRLRGDDSGIRAVGRLRAHHPGLAAVLISGDTAPDRLQEAERAGLTLLHKPVPVDVLARAIAERVHDRAAGRAS